MDQNEINDLVADEAEQSNPTIENNNENEDEEEETCIRGRRRAP